MVVKVPRSYLILAVILLLGLFLRTWQFERFYLFEHDNDLYSWIVKDIWVDHHIRLIGQETSVDKLFIGPLFYYLLVPFYTLGGMSPLAAAAPTTLVGLLTIVSFYFIFTKYFGVFTGLIGAFLYSISIGVVLFDRWVVPTQLTGLWSIWLLYCLLSFVKHDLKTLPILAALAGLVWHIHIALLPPLFLAIGALLLFNYRQLFPDLKAHSQKWLLSLAILLGLMLPFAAFEVKHGFWQTRGLFLSTVTDKEEIGGFSRPFKVLEEAFRSQINIFSLNSSFQKDYNQLLYFPIILICLVIFLVKTKALSKKEALILALWPIVVIAAHSFSKRSLTEYYFYNLLPVTILILSLILSLSYKTPKLRPIFGLIMVIISWYSITAFFNRVDYGNGYLYKSRLVKFITSDAKANHYPCISVNFIADFGTAVGFRYLFWFNNLRIITPGNDVPVYNIAIPQGYIKDQPNYQFGSFGLIIPEYREVNPSACSDPSRQLQPLLGFTK